MPNDKKKEDDKKTVMCPTCKGVGLIFPPLVKLHIGVPGDDSGSRCPLCGGSGQIPES